ncbi:MAG: cytochrome P450 [Beijerinckiaceae bacterium]|nr:cytochrome P450 [Beijerinckiaceae bacterium]
MGIAESFAPIGAKHDELLAFLREARASEPVFHWAEHDVWIVTRYEDVQKVLGDAQHFTVEGNLGVMNAGYCPAAKDILATGIDWINVAQVNGVEGPVHARLRKVMQNILTPQRFREMEPRVRGEVNRLIDEFEARGACDFVREFAYPLPVHVIFAVIGFLAGEEDLEQLQRWSDDTFMLWLAPLTPEQQVECAKNAVEFQRYIAAKIADRRANPRDDLLTDFVREVDAGDGRLSEEELTIMFPMNLIGAGHETTKSALGNALYHMLREPARWQAIVDDPSIIPGAVEESLRWDGSVFGWYRTVAADVEIGGKTLPAGAKVVAALGSANHDEAKFNEPERFCPTRGNKPPHMTFSFGRHFCPGAPLARMELRIALEELARRLPNLRLKAGQSISYDPSLATRTLSKLELEWDAGHA